LINSEINTKKKKIQSQQSIIHAENKLDGNLVNPRTAQSNVKFPAQTVEEEQIFRESLVEEQIKVWRKLIPGLLDKLSRIPDLRNPEKTKHKVTVIMLMGILLFIMKVESLRLMNNLFSRPVFKETLRKIFPEFESTPHSSTISRFLENVDPLTIEEVTVSMLKDLIRKKTFKKFYILGHLPISIDGVQKVVRNGELYDQNWLQRTIKTVDGEKIQKYVYVLEVNITLHNGLSIPLMTEFLYYDGNPNIGKQDCELVAVKRLAQRLKAYFKRQNIVILLDKLYANDSVISLLDKLSWKFIIVLPSHKLKKINEELKKDNDKRFLIPDLHKFRGRNQEWIISNLITTNAGNIINAISCLESWKEVDKDSGETINRFSEHKWITNFELSIENLHEIANLGARKRWGIEDSNNTEKNRGYNYKHLFSYNWNAMKCYHYLMRLGHILNAISEFTKNIKGMISKFGCSFILNIIKETLSNPWLNAQWINNIASGNLKFYFDW
jgi:hypothetical protein